MVDDPRLPHCGGPNTAEEAGEYTGAARPAGSAVLVVEDEATVRAATCLMLEHLGFEVAEAANGREALEVFEAQRNRIAVVFMDVNMPEMNGLKAMKGLQETGIGVPVVVCTGYDEHDLEHTYASYGFFGFLAKPFTLDALSALINKAFDA